MRARYTRTPRDECSPSPRRSLHVPNHGEQHERHSLHRQHLQMRGVIQPEWREGIKEARNKTPTPVRTEGAAQRIHRYCARRIRQQHREVIAHERVPCDDARSATR